MDWAKLDIEDFPALIAYLRDTGHIVLSEQPRLTNLAGGVSNRTVLLERESGDAWVLKQALAKLRVAVDWFSDPARIEREADGMQALSELMPPGSIPRFIFLDPQVHLLAMEAVPQPHENFKCLLLAGKIQGDHFRQFGALLGHIHRGGWVRRDELSKRFADRQYFESLRIEPYYVYASEQPGILPRAKNFLQNLITHTRATANTLVHGDYSPKNILIHRGKLILLDHEVIHFGDGAFDLGFSFAHLLSKANHLPLYRAGLANASLVYWNTYLQSLGDVPWFGELPQHAVNHTLACLLARCIGRSPLEYLTAVQRERQSGIVMKLMRHPPAHPAALISAFLEALDQEPHADD